jgi:prepilin-type N-terminal cleavage/methylation domain-containing protein
MWLNRRRSKGFTLFEVLMVVVIIGILATLVVPRILVQTEKALAAEALQMVGGIQRALQEKYDLTKSYGSNTDIVSDGGGCYFGLTQGAWTEIGIKGPEFSKQWSYWLHRDGDYYIEACNNAGGNDMIIYSNGSATCSGSFSPNSDGSFCVAK